MAGTSVRADYSEICHITFGNMSNNFDIFPNQKKKKQAAYLFCVFFFFGGFRLFFPFECQKAEIQEVIQNNINALQKNIKTELIFFCCIFLFRFGENEKEQHSEQYQSKLILILFFLLILGQNIRRKGVNTNFHRMLKS